MDMESVKRSGSTFDRVRNELECMFDFSEDFGFAGMVFPLYARYYRRNTKYFAVKKMELYAFSNFEHMFFCSLEGDLERRELEQLLDRIKENLEDLIQPNHEHMSSIITFIVECDGIEDAAEVFVRGYKYRKSFKFGFHGWVDFKIIVTVRNTNRVVESKLAIGDSQKLQIIES